MELSKQITIKFEFGEEVITFPNAGQFMEIQALKMNLTSNTYSEMMKQGLKSNEFTLDLVDSIVYFTILVPGFRERLKIKSITDLDLFEAKKIIKIYKDQFYPWLSKLLKELYEDIE